MSGSIPFGELRAWMFDALALWARLGVDDQGGFREDLALDGRPSDTPYVRTRVICRQIYSFAQGFLLGWSPGAALAEAGCAYLEAKARLPNGGWAKRLSREGKILDPAPDLYDLGFVLFAFAWRYRISGDPRAQRLAHETLDYVKAELVAPQGGYWPMLPHRGMRLQNPHMHLTEACIAAYEAFGDARFLAEAQSLVALFRARFFDGRTLGECFGEDWARQSAGDGGVLEPGHHFEWAWILAQYARIAGAEVAPEAAALVAFAEAHGVDPVSGEVFGAVREDGSVVSRSARSWAQTERIKGHLGLFELTGADPTAALASTARLLLDRYLAVTPRGLCIDQFDDQGRPAAQIVPGSLLYHCVLAFSETLRLEPKLKTIDVSQVSRVFRNV